MQMMQGRARFDWRANRISARDLPATRRLAGGAAHAPSRTLPCRATCCSRRPAGEVPAPRRPGGLLEGFCPDPRPEEQIALNCNGSLLLLRLSDIDWLEAAGQGVTLHVGRQVCLLDQPLAAVVAKLPPDRFLRVGPSAVVNLARIKNLRRLCQGEWRVLLRNGTRLT